MAYRRGFRVSPRNGKIEIAATERSNTRFIHLQGRMAEWEAAATKIHDEGYCRTVPTTKVAHALRYLYDHRPTMSLRAIGATPEVDLHHDNVGKIRAGATAVFGTAPGAGRT